MSRVVDQWVGGSSPSCQYRYRLVELTSGQYQVEVSMLDDPDMDEFYRPVTRGSVHSVAARLGELLRDDHKERKTNRVKRA
jgi:hypothetical protein